ncbi:hypothetical protein BDR07DRAFT_1450530 [Suillus spraguei]|nr:hypothetical protein BDR07DRAFT_1450530 [Suillus spraguei]
MTLLPLTILLLLYIPNTRTFWDIIWNCAATLFACTWTAVHPNIPGLDEGKFIVFSRRLGFMMAALVSPELMIIWATIQFLSACDTAKAFNDAFGWTVTHGFFAWMGGSMLYVNGKPRATLTPKELEHFVHEGFADIKDRSKGDALSKGIAVLQLMWFVVQLVARYVQNLPITLLELDTLAVAVLTGIAYGFWWKKPKDAGRPHAVYWKATVPLPSDLAYEYVVNILA